MMIRRTWALGGAIALASAFLSACSSDAEVGLPAGGGPTAGGSPSGVEQTVATTPSVSGDAGPTNADVTLTSFRFEPSAISIEAGEDLRVANEDATVDHTFTIEDEGVDEIVPAGEDASVRADLPAGTYTVICRFHVQQGMEATLEIG